MKHWKVIIILALVTGTLFTIGRHAMTSKTTTLVETIPGDKKIPGAQDQTVGQNIGPNGEKLNSNAATSKYGTGGGTLLQSGTQGATSGTNPATGTLSTNLSGAGTSPSGSIPGAAPEKPKPESNCFVYEYQHKPEAKQKDIEDFMDYTNAFPITHKNLNAKSLCVKVNNQAVAFKMGKFKSDSEVVVGSVVGPESVIRISYCTGTAVCKENCALPQKRFMDDLVSDAGADDEFGDSWGDSQPKTAEQKKQLHAHVKEFRSVASENESLTKQSMMRDWTTLSHQESVCSKK